jgi:NTE family protein
MDQTLAALYCHHCGDFNSFENKVRGILAKGFIRPAVRVALTTREGVSVLVCVLPLAVERLAAFLVRLALRAIDPNTASEIT